MPATCNSTVAAAGSNLKPAHLQRRRERRRLGLKLPRGLIRRRDLLLRPPLPRLCHFFRALCCRQPPARVVERRRQPRGALLFALQIRHQLLQVAAASLGACMRWNVRPCAYNLGTAV